jgi:hypothetical protein
MEIKMSRTFRKKNEISYDVSKIRDGNSLRPTNEKERMRLLHKQFGDRRACKRNVSSDFKKDLNAQFKAKNKEILFNEVNFDKDVGYHPFFKYEYW